MFRKIANGEWLAHSPRTVAGVNVKPFIVADSAFPLSSTCMKCYEVGQPAYRRSFNYSLIRTRRVVEQAFRRLKGCWKIMGGKCSLKDPLFIRQVAVACCALRSIWERHQCPFEPGWLPNQQPHVQLGTSSIKTDSVLIPDPAWFTHSFFYPGL